VLGGAPGAAEDLYREFESLAEGVEAFERYYIRRVLAEERRDLAGTARRLGVADATLTSRMKVLGIA
jgi:transcriptional regulator with GAF, ATPase, and Fis domain